MDQAIQDFVQFVNNIENPVVQLQEELHENISLRNWNKRTFRTMNLSTLIRDIQNYPTFFDWWKSLNLTKHLNNVLVKTILNQNPPDSVKHALIFIML